MGSFYHFLYFLGLLVTSAGSCSITQDCSACITEPNCIFVALAPQKFACVETEKLLSVRAIRTYGTIRRCGTIGTVPTPQLPGDSPVLKPTPAPSAVEARTTVHTTTTTKPDVANNPYPEEMQLLSHTPGPPANLPPPKEDAANPARRHSPRDQKHANISKQPNLESTELPIFNNPDMHQGNPGYRLPTTDLVNTNAISLSTDFICDANGYTETSEEKVARSLCRSYLLIQRRSMFGSELEAWNRLNPMRRAPVQCKYLHWRKQNCVQND